MKITKENTNQNTKKLYDCIVNGILSGGNFMNTSKSDFIYCEDNATYPSLECKEGKYHFELSHDESIKIWLIGLEKILSKVQSAARFL